MALHVIVHEAGRRWIGLVRSRLRLLPVQVHHSTCSADCLTAVASARPACVLLLELGSDPAAILELMARALGVAPDTKVLVLAGSGQRRFELPSRQLGAVAFLTPPVDSAVLAAVVERSLGRKRGQEPFLLGEKVPDTFSSHWQKRFLTPFPRFDPTRCTRCGDCLAACPTECLELSAEAPEVAWPARCISCALCQAVCPTDAVAMPP